MSNGQIPINIEDLPIDSMPLDESGVYRGRLEKAAVAPKLDRRGNVYAILQFVVVDGDFDGKTITMNYLALPTPIDASMSKAERIRAMDKTVTFARFARSFRISGVMPTVTFEDPETITTWNEWITKFVGAEGTFTVKNQEWPEGSGRLRSGVSDFLI